MKESRQATKDDVIVKASSGKKAEDRTVVVAKSVCMPNPVKGLKLSLYPMTKQH